ncbi:polysaccharide deacetylase family protein [Brevibacillus daliensis]|uniref:polysaccharide deacetylase family protein n=1 Tax=Brevibacillus daliensis TaxID=2892995 RepID=UPI001E44F6F4|nr:polysaccharide deacetylase family protein [Brevibacillus daliensis]
MLSKPKIVMMFHICIALLLLPTSEVGSQSRDRDYYEKKGEVVWELPTEKKVIALTFDDGPDRKITPQILSLLKKHNAHATFFTVGNRIKKNPEIIKQMALQHHEISNHTFSHPDLRHLSTDQIRKQIQETQNIIQDITGTKPTLFRPPGGYYSQKVIATAKEMGYLVVMWSWHQDTRDWSDPGVSKIVNKVIKNARNGDIVLFHDFGGRREQTVHALEKILPELEKKGYHFVTVSELIAIRNQYPVKTNLIHPLSIQKQEPSFKESERSPN